jgi:drug/metabolite transporter (DMT)-like permease
LRPLYGAVLKLVSTFVFGLMLVAVKLVGDRVPPGEVVFFRSFFGAVPVLLMVAWQHELIATFKTPRPVGHVLRSFFGVSSMMLGFAAYQRMPIADALAIGYASPLLTVIIAALTLGEVVRGYRWSAIAIGFTGVVVILWPHLADLERINTDKAALGAVLAFAGALFGAFAATQVRRLTLMQEDADTIVVYFSLGCALISLLSIPLQPWVWPSNYDLVFLIGAGLTGGVGQILLTRAYFFADASIVAPLEYVSIIWAVLFGWWLFGDLPDVTVSIGSVIVVFSGIIIIWREHQLGLRRDAEERAGRM